MAISTLSYKLLESFLSYNILIAIQSPFFETGFCYVAQAALKLNGSSDSPTCHVTGTSGASHHTYRPPFLTVQMN
jgi:hypothetical protein